MSRLSRFRGIAAVVAAACLWGGGPALSQAYPTRAVRVVVGFPAGGGVDVPARLISHWRRALLPAEQ